jgi:ABC-type phosphate/phosphonate transport system substrate-binding protein
MGALTSADQAEIPIAQTRILALTGRTPHDAICAGPKTDAQTAKRMREVLLQFDPMEHAGVQRLGTIERLTGFAEGSEDDYIPLRQALNMEKK